MSETTMKTATLPQEDWDLILALLRNHSDAYRWRLEGDYTTSKFYNEMLTNAIAETDDLHLRIQQQVSND